MPPTRTKISVCIEMVFEDLPYPKRVEEVARLGFDGFEFWGLEGKDVRGIHRAAKDSGIAIATFLASTGRGTMGGLVNPENLSESACEMRGSIATAVDLGVRRLIVTVGNALDGVPREKQLDAILRKLQAVARDAEDAGVTLCVEMLNTTVDHAGYFLDDTDTGIAIVEAVGSPAVKVLYDIYHMQIMEGNLISTIRKIAPRIGHFHAADVPGRNEPGTGEINYTNIMKAIDATGYDGYLGLEYTPTKDHRTSLAEVKELLRG